MKLNKLRMNKRNRVLRGEMHDEKEGRKNTQKYNAGETLGKTSEEIE